MRDSGPPTATPLPDHVRELLGRPLSATISTLDDDGAPHQAVVWFVLRDDAILVNSRRERHWPRNLARDPRISVAVEDDGRRFHWIGLKGRAELLHGGAAATDDIMALARRYGADPEKYRGQDRVSFVVRIDHVFEYGD